VAMTTISQISVYFKLTKRMNGMEDSNLSELLVTTKNAILNLVA